jgi:hypothetical protein
LDALLAIFISTFIDSQQGSLDASLVISIPPSLIARSQADFCLDALTEIFIHTNSQQLSGQVSGCFTAISIPTFTDSQQSSRQVSGCFIGKIHFSVTNSQQLRRQLHW